MKRLHNDTMVVPPDNTYGHMDMLGIRLSVVARMGPSSDDVALVRLRIGPGQSIPLHTHEQECIYVLGGEIEVFLAGDKSRWYIIGSGQSIVVPANVEHAVRNMSDNSADVLAVVSVRLAEFFLEVSTPASAAEPNPPTPADLERFVRKASEYNYWLASPEESAAITG